MKLLLRAIVVNKKLEFAEKCFTLVGTSLNFIFESSNKIRLASSNSNWQIILQANITKVNYFALHPSKLIY